MPPDEAGALSEQLDELAGILAGLGTADWSRPTRCDGWDVADVVLHLAQTNEMAVASLEGRYPESVARLTAGLPPARDVDEGAASMVAQERGQPTSAVRHRWLESARALAAGAGTADPSVRVMWVAGLLSARTLTTTRLAETWIHTGDVAEAVGVTLAPAERLRAVARLAWRTLPYAFERANRRLGGPVAFHLRGPSGAAWDLVPDDEPLTVIRGSGPELCLVAARRLRPEQTGLTAEGPDGPAVLELVRTYA